jgi:hypothetical protein
LVGTNGDKRNPGKKININFQLDITLFGNIIEKYKNKLGINNADVKVI